MFRFELEILEIFGYMYSRTTLFAPYLSWPQGVVKKVIVAKCEVLGKLSPVGNRPLRFRQMSTR